MLARITRIMQCLYAFTAPIQCKKVHFATFWLACGLEIRILNFSMLYSISEKEYAAIIMIRESGIGAIDAALLAREALAAGRGRLSRARRCLALGALELRNEERTVSFRHAVEEALAARLHRRPRTLVDFRYFCRRLMRCCKGLASRRVRGIKADECRKWIEQAFDTPQQRRKARAILSGVFSTSVRKGWCSANPVAQVEIPMGVERQLPILTPQEIGQLLQAAASYEGGCCQAAVGMMLYGGIRPHEVARLAWEHVDLLQKVIYIPPRHSKTGGARCVTIHLPLLRILQRRQRPDGEKVCPANWLHHWRALRQWAGWNPQGHPWRQDVLRHTFASYHLLHFRSYATLQCEMGHRDANLLRTRYINTRGVCNAAAFWEA